MKIIFTMMSILLTAISPVLGTTIMVVPVYEPLSLHGTDGDEAISDTGEALQACVMARPMALSGAFPEDLIAAIRSPHLLPSNNENYKVREANLLVLCGITIEPVMREGVLHIALDVTNLSIPAEVDLTSKQIVKLTIVAIRKTLENYQAGQDSPLEVMLSITGTSEKQTSLAELGAEFSIGDQSPE
jgi:hypothetical protein